MKLIDRFIPATQNENSVDVAQAVSEDKNYIYMRRPYLNGRGVPCVTINMGRWTKNDSPDGEKRGVREIGVPVLEALNKGYQVPLWALNATSFRRDDWIQIDTEVQTVYRARLKLVAALQGAVSVPGGGWGKLTYEYDAMSDSHEAIVDMDGLSEGRSDAPTFLPRSVPQPFTHSDFWYSDRVLAASRARGGQGLDVYSAEQAARRVAEMVEKTAIGIETGITFGGRTGYFPHDLASTVFGLTNYTNRNTKTNFTTPTTSNGPTSYAEVLAALETLFLDKVYGPFTIYHSTEWSQYMNSPFSTAGGNHPSETLRTMLLKIPDIKAVERLDFLTGLTGGNTYTLLFVALDKRYIRFIDGMGPTTWQWDTRGGHQKNFKVGVVQSILPMSDYTGQCGILHGTTA